MRRGWLALALALLPASAGAQSAASRPAATDPGRTTRLLARADSLFARAEVSRAEGLYYALARQAPEDPRPRAALGRYLAARGAFLVGATLLAEAAEFSATPSLGEAARLDQLRAEAATQAATGYEAERHAPLMAAGAWSELLGLRRAPLAGAAAARARALATLQGSRGGADSVTVGLDAPSSASALGRLALRIGNGTVLADLDPTIDELVLGDQPGAQWFAAEDGSALGILPILDIAGLVLTQVPVRRDARLGTGRARIGLAMLAPMAPTVDAAAGVVTLRRDGRVTVKGDTVALRFAFPGVEVARPERWVPMASPAGRAVLATARWTLDPRRGLLILETDSR
jgi:hypothetical protein